MAVVIYLGRGLFMGALLAHPLFVVPHLREWATAKEFLQAVPRGSDAVRDTWPVSLRWELTLDHLRELSDAGRDDLVVWLLASAASDELLRDVAVGEFPDSWRAAVCARRSAPVAAVVRAYSGMTDRRVKSAVAWDVERHLCVAASDLASALAFATSLLDAPDEELPEVLRRVQEWEPLIAGRAGTRVASMALDRGRPVPAAVWSALVDYACRVEPQDTGGLVEALAKSPQASSEDLLRLMSMSLVGSEAAAVLVALLRRGVFPPPEEYPSVYQACDGLWTEQFAAAISSPELAERLMYERGALAAAAVASGVLPESALLAWAEFLLDEVGREGIRVWDALLFELLPLVSSVEFLERVVEVCESRHDYVPLTFLARNPAAPVALQERLAGSLYSPVVDGLLANPKLDAAVALAVVSAGSHPNDQWSILLENEPLAREVTSLMPACVFAGIATVPWPCPAQVVWLESELGPDMGRWREFEALLPEWHGSIGDLVHVLRVL